MHRSGIVIALGATAFLLCHAAHSQVAKYEVIDLGVLPGSSLAESRAFAINNLHEIAGQSKDSSGVPHAAVWLFCENYGLSAQVWHDLSPSGEEPYSGWALDINDAGLVVGGQVIFAHSALNRPYVWDLAAPANNVELATFYDDPDFGIYGTGDAWAVNNGNPAQIVGGAQLYITCASNAFLYSQGDAASAITDLGVAGSDTSSLAVGINDLGTPQAAGTSDTTCLFSSCSQNRDAVNWTLGTSPSLTVLPDSGGTYGAEAHGINNANQLAGMFLTTDSPCRVHAAFWPSSASSPVDLGTVGVTATHFSLAHKLTPAGANNEVTVVGEDSTDGRAWRWHRNSGGTWSGANLNTLISPLCGWTLVRANDISDDGWIVGNGSINNEPHGFLLRPVVCLGDLDHSGLVDGADLGLLLGAWSCATAPCALCRADLNLDGIVNGADLGILLGAWNNGCDDFACQTKERGFLSSENLESLDALLNQGLILLGLESAQTFKNWRESASAEQLAAAEEWLFGFLTTQF